MSFKSKIAIIASLILITLIVLLRPYYLFVTQTLKISTFKTLFSLDGIKTYDDHINILFLGIAGANHDGPNLSDSIVVLSYDLKTNSLTTISIPRDVWSDTLHDKINSAYAYGGFILAKAEVQIIIGQPIHYALAINFDQFEKLIDFLGGVEVNVDNSFVDNEFPITGKENDLCDGDKEFKCRYETLSFVQGGQKMDGELALKYVRSRNGDNGENTDLAREARQQKVITAIKNEVLSVGGLINFSRDIKIYKALKASVETNIDRKAGLVLAQRLFLARDNIASYVFPDDLLVSPPVSARYDNQYVFIPKIGNWEEIGNWFNNLLTP